MAKRLFSLFALAVPVAATAFIVITSFAIWVGTRMESELSRMAQARNGTGAPGFQGAGCGAAPGGVDAAQVPSIGGGERPGAGMTWGEFHLLVAQVDPGSLALLLGKDEARKVIARARASNRSQERRKGKAGNPGPPESNERSKKSRKSAGRNKKNKKEPSAGNSDKARKPKQPSAAKPKPDKSLAKALKSFRAIERATKRTGAPTVKSSPRPTKTNKPAARISKSVKQTTTPSRPPKQSSRLR